MEVMIFYLDSSGKRRGWAKGPADDVDQVRADAKARLAKWIATQNEAIGQDEWSEGDFEEFVADVRETS